MVIAASSHLLTIGQFEKFLFDRPLFIFALMTVLFLSVKVGLIATLPNIFPILVVFGLMGWRGSSLSMVTSLVRQHRHRVGRGRHHPLSRPL